MGYTVELKSLTRWIG